MRVKEVRLIKDLLYCDGTREAVMKLVHDARLQPDKLQCLSVGGNALLFCTAHALSTMATLQPVMPFGCSLGCSAGIRLSRAVKFHVRIALPPSIPSDALQPTPLINIAIHCSAHPFFDMRLTYLRETLNS